MIFLYIVLESENQNINLGGACDHLKTAFKCSTDPDINHPTIDTCNYIIDTNNLSIKSSKELVVMTFNIRSIKKNFDNLNCLVA